MRSCNAIAAIIVATAVSVSAEISSVQGYVRDGEIGLSVRNELDAAQSRARRWLVATQLESGAWEATYQCGATALAAIALMDISNASGEEAEMFSAASRRAVSWLREMSEEQLSKAIREERAWRDFVLASASWAEPTLAHPHEGDAPSGHANQSLRAELAPEFESAQTSPQASGAYQEGATPSRGRAFANVMSAMADMAPDGIVHECAKEIAEGTEESRAALASKLAVAWRDDGIVNDPQWGVSRTRFMIACFISSFANGILSAEKDGRLVRVPWREDVAGALISKQRVDPKHAGTAFWRGSADDFEHDWAADAVPETAFALLCIGLL